MIYPFFVKFLLLQLSPLVQKFQCTVVCPNLFCSLVITKLFHTNSKYSLQVTSNYRQTISKYALHVLFSVCLNIFKCSKWVFMRLCRQFPWWFIFFPWAFFQSLIWHFWYHEDQLTVRHSDGSGDSGISEALDLIAYQSTSEGAYLWEGVVSSVHGAGASATIDLHIFDMGAHVQIALF